MNKKLLIFAFFVLLIVLSFATVMAVAKTKLAEFEVINKSGQPVSISLVNEEAYYYLTVGTGETKIFTVERLVYDQTIWSCGLTDSGTVNLETYLRLTFTNCFGDAPNQGEPSLEKVHIDDAPTGFNHHFEYASD